MIDLQPSTPSVASGTSTTLAPQMPFGAVDQFFDYAAFMWDGDVWQQNPSPGAPGGSSPEVHDPLNSGRAQPFRTLTPSLNHQVANAVGAPPAGDHLLMEYFMNTAVPPILAQVETQQKWSSMRQALISMSNRSSMVRASILAFSELLVRREQGAWQTNWQTHYQEAVTEFAAAGDISTITSYSSKREDMLATLFFLSYSDILDGRVELAHSHLKSAHVLFRQDAKTSFRPVEIRILSWIRLLDARAVSAGGEGLFLSDDEEQFLIQPSPASLETEADGATEVPVEASDIEDVLFQVLYQPGLVFFQKVQSFMGRISKIDPWHRSRGTVEDETEVMNIGAGIAKDLRVLYDNRPPLMDFAVDGKLTTPHVSPTLAFTITRAFRTYVSNYYASKVHLHRVAYKTLPLTREAAEALEQIRHLVRLVVDSLGAEEALPVNMLWPLLMLGSEEKDLGEREWIKQNIMRMEKVATNARITAQVLDEVQARQDATNARVDIRSIMHAIFDSCFAIV